MAAVGDAYVVSHPSASDEEHLGLIVRPIYGPEAFRYAGILSATLVNAQISASVTLPDTIGVTGSVAVSNFPATQAVYVTPESTFASVQVHVSGTGEFELVPAQAGLRVKVSSYMIQAGESANSASVLTFKDGATSASLAGPFFLGDREGISMVGAPPVFLFATGTGSFLVVSLSGSRECGGFLTYFRSVS